MTGGDVVRIVPHRDGDAGKVPRADRRRLRDAVAALSEAERVRWAQQRVAAQAAREGRRDARRGRWPPRTRADLEPFARDYAEAFLVQLRARWPAEVVARVVKARRWIVRAADGRAIGTGGRRKAPAASAPDEARAIG